MTDWNKFKKKDYNWYIDAIGKILKNKFSKKEEAQIERLIDTLVKNGMDEHLASAVIQEMIDIGARNERNDSDLNL